MPAATLPEGAAAPRTDRRVHLLQVDPGLRAAIPPEEQAGAARMVTAAALELPRGHWRPEDLRVPEAIRSATALMLRGVVVHEVLIGGRSGAELIAPGDLFRPWRTGDTALPCSTRAHVSGKRAIVAVLDDQFLSAARRWPSLQRALHARFADQLDTAARRAAITGLPRVEQRVLALFWQLADRFGGVTSDGIVVRLDLTHDLVGRLIGAKRPTVSLAFATLASQGHLTRSGPGQWRLSSESYEELLGEWGARGRPAAPA